MAEQERKHSRRDDSPLESEVDITAPRVGGDLTGKIDDLLDEIDSVLEDNAEEFIKNYVQKGGE